MYVSALLGMALILIGVFGDLGTLASIGGILLAISAVILIAKLFHRPPTIKALVEPDVFDSSPQDENQPASHVEAKADDAKRKRDRAI